MDPDAGRDRRSRWLLVSSGAGILLGLAAAVFLIGAAVLRSESSRGLLASILTASAVVLIAGLLLPSIYYSRQRLRGLRGPEAAPPLIRVWQVILLVIAWTAALVLAGLFYEHPILRWFTPPLYLLSIGLPVYSFVRLATGGLGTGSRQRAWGVFGISMLSGPALAILAEGAIGLIALAAAALYAAFNPGVADSLQEVARQIRDAGDAETMLRVAGPYLDSPLVWIGALAFLSVLTPLIEETAKSLGVWLVSGRVRSAAEGFALGALSGAGFGLVESLLVSATPDTDWGMTLAVRGASSMMHIFTASLTGWGIASARLNRKYWHALLGYAAAMTIHGIWNAAVLGVVFGALRLLPGLTNPAALDPLNVFLMVAALALLIGLVTLLAILLGAINWQFRSTATAITPAPAGEVGQSG